MYSEMGFEDMNWIPLDQDRAEWRDIVKMEMSLRHP
jgi:hypothetical protein